MKYKVVVDMRAMSRVGLPGIQSECHARLLLAASLALLLLLCGCSDNTSEPNSVPPQESLIGSWELDSTHSGDESHYYEDNEMFWLFHEGGIVNAMAQSGSIAYECYFAGAFAATDSTLCISGIEDGPLDCRYSFSADTDTLRLAYEFDVGPGWLEFIRVEDAPDDSGCGEADGKPRD